MNDTANEAVVDQTLVDQLHADLSKKIVIGEVDEKLYERVDALDPRVFGAVAEKFVNGHPQDRALFSGLLGEIAQWRGKAVLSAAKQFAKADDRKSAFEKQVSGM